MSSIEWTEKTWNPLSGCDKISPGCKFCYAIPQAHRLAAMGQQKYKGTTKRQGTSLNWTGLVNLDVKALAIPLKEKKPTVYFVNSMSDLFHDEVPIEFIADVFAVMYLTPYHTYQLLTKRDARMQSILSDSLFESAVIRSVDRIFKLYSHYFINDTLGSSPIQLSPEQIKAKMPLLNLWLGVSVEDQHNDKRIENLIKTPAALRWLSCEPLIAPLDLIPQLGYPIPGTKEYIPPIDWVVVGGESGTGERRKTNPDWVRSIRNQCRALQIPFFFKQWGKDIFNPDSSDPTIAKDHPDHAKGGCMLDGEIYRQYPKIKHV